jgi:uncharacterized protein (TIGR00730 family)
MHVTSNQGTAKRGYEVKLGIRRFMMKITVFGGANPKPQDPAYLEAYHLGKILGQAGHSLLTGGYIGTMEAVSKGANEAGAHVIGVTCDEIEEWRPISINKWVHEEIRCKTLQERVFVLIDQCDAAIALPGGIGTLTEIAMLWNHMVIDAVKKKKLILVGKGWQTIFNDLFLFQGSYISSFDRGLILFTANPDSIPPLLNQKSN